MPGKRNRLYQKSCNTPSLRRWTQEREKKKNGSVGRVRMFGCGGRPGGRGREESGKG